MTWRLHPSIYAGIGILLLYGGFQTWRASDAQNRAERAEEVADSLAVVRDVYLQRSDSLRSVVADLGVRYSADSTRWAQERSEAVQVVTIAEDDHDELEARIRAQMDSATVILLDSLSMAHDQVVEAQQVQIQSLEEERGVLLARVTTLTDLSNQLTAAVDAGDEVIRNLEAANDARQDQIRAMQRKQWLERGGGLVAIAAVAVLAFTR